MTLHLAAKAAKDGGGTAITGGVTFNDESGAGTGPFDLAHIVLDSTQKEILGTQADAAATTTDVTPISAMSVWKQVSKTLQAVLGSTVLTRGAGAADAGTLRVSVGSDQLSALATAFDVLNNAGVGGQKVYLPTDQPAAVKVQALANGQTNSRVVALATTNPVSLKASAGNIFDIDLFNVAAYDVFLKLYNKASAPTVGTDVPVRTIPIKAGTGYARSFPFGKSFATGIAYAITKLQADTDTTVLVAGDVTGSIDWI